MQSPQLEFHALCGNHVNKAESHFMRTGFLTSCLGSAGNLGILQQNAWHLSLGQGDHNYRAMEKDLSLSSLGRPNVLQNIT